MQAPPPHLPHALRLLALLVAALLLGGCLSKSQFYGKFSRNTQSQFNEFGEYRLETRSYEQYRYNFWGETYEGIRLHFGATSLVNYPLCVTLLVDREQTSPTVYINDGQEYRVEPGQTVWIGDLLYSSKQGRTAQSNQIKRRRC